MSKPVRLILAVFGFVITYYMTFWLLAGEVFSIISMDSGKWIVVPAIFIVAMSSLCSGLVVYYMAMGVPLLTAKHE